MKKGVSGIGIFLLSLLLSAGEWEIKNMPAMYDNPGELHVIPGEVQAFTFYFVAPPEVLTQAKPKQILPKGEVTVSIAQKAVGKDRHRLKVEFTLPQGVEFLASSHSSPKHTITVSGTHVSDEYVCAKVDLPLPTGLSEWKTYKVALRIPAESKSKEETLTLRLSHEGRQVAEKTWKIKRCAPFTPAPKLKKLKLGLWDYGFNWLGKGIPGIVSLWKKAGIGTSSNIYSGCKDFPAMPSVHHGHFTNSAKFPDRTPNGSLLRTQVNGWYLRHTKLTDALPKVIPTVVGEARRSGCNWVGMDYEINGFSGFLPGSIADFKKEYHVSDAEFASMQKLMAEKNYAFGSLANEKQRATFLLWNRYQSSLQAEFIRQLRTELRKAAPEVKFFNTCMDVLPPPDPKGTNLCVDASLEAPYLDCIMPQIYMGYGEVAAKSAITRVREWRLRLQELKAACLLHPLLLVRYSNGRIRNSAALLRQQTIGAIAEGASGVSYYFAQCFNADDWAELAETTRLLAQYEDFYTEGKHCEAPLKLTGMAHRTDWQPLWPNVKRKVVDPDWHVTAHEWQGRTLVTVFALNPRQEFRAKLETSRRLLKIQGGKIVDGFLVIPPGGIAFLTLER